MRMDGDGLGLGEEKLSTFLLASSLVHGEIRLGPTDNQPYDVGQFFDSA